MVLLKEKFIEIKTEKVDIAIAIASLPVLRQADSAFQPAFVGRQAQVLGNFFH